MIVMRYNVSDLHQKVRIALRALFCKDARLLDLDVHEQSITHSLANHLQSQFADLDVDCEYNRHGEDPKKLGDDKIIPDIVVHKRGCDCSNAMVIEVKKSNGDRTKKDENKLSGLTIRECGYGYSLGMLLVIDVRSKALGLAECFVDGEKTPQCRWCQILKAEFPVHVDPPPRRPPRSVLWQPTR